MLQRPSRGPHEIARFRRVRTAPGRLGRKDARILRAGTLDQLPDRGDALPDSDAHRREAVLGVTVHHLANKGAHEPGAAATQRMPERDRTSVDVDLLLIQSEQ